MTQKVMEEVNARKKKLGKTAIWSIGMLNENVWEEFRDVRF